MNHPETFRPFPVGRALVEPWRELFTHRRLALRLAALALPVLVLWHWVSQLEGLVRPLGLQIVFSFAILALGVAPLAHVGYHWLRALLLELPTRDVDRAFRWSRPEMRFYRKTIGFSIWAVLLASLFIFGVVLVLVIGLAPLHNLLVTLQIQVPDAVTWMAQLAWFFGVPFLLGAATLRFCLAFPAIAIEGKGPRFWWSYEVTSGNGWRMAVASLGALAPLAGLMVLGAQLPTTGPWATTNFVVNAAGVVLFALLELGILAVAYRILVLAPGAPGWVLPEPVDSPNLSPDADGLDGLQYLQVMTTAETAPPARPD